jgi:uncharacterized protein
MSEATGGRRQRRDGWVWYSLLPLGLGAWATVVAGIRCGVRQWIGLGLFWTAAAIAGWTMSLVGTIVGSNTSYDGNPHGAAAAVIGIGVMLMFLAWIGGLATAFSIRSAYDRLRAEHRAPKSPWPTPTERSRRWSAPYAVVAFLVAFGIETGIGALLVDGFGVHLSVGAGVLIVDGTLLLTLVPIAIRRGLSAPDLGLRPTRPVRSAGLVALVFVIYLTFTIVYSLIFIDDSTRQSAHVVSQANNFGTFETILTIFAVGVSAPVVEETFFRGLVYRSLRNRLPVFWAALLAGCLFGLAHIGGYPLITLPIKAFFGILACLLYEKTGSLLPGIAVHSLVDASVVELALTGNDDVVLIVFGTAFLVIFLRWVVLGLLRADTPTPYGPPPPARQAGALSD